MGTNVLLIASDHAGFELKKQLSSALKTEFPKWEFRDLGPESAARVDYPDFASKVAALVSAGQGLGLLICGSGIGMSITANKYKGVRAASVWDSTSARLSRQHNDANVVCIGARLIGYEVALDALRSFLTAAFEGGRHQERIEKIGIIERAGSSSGIVS